MVAQSQRVIVKNIPGHDLKTLNFGFSLGINTMDFRIKASEFAVENDLFAEVSSLTPGFNINVVSNLRLSENFDLRVLPGVSFGQRKIDFYTMDGQGLPGSKDGDSQSEPRLVRSQEMESSFLELPFVIKYKSVRINNYRPYLLGGVNFKYDLAKNFSEEDEIFLSLRPFDIFFEIGFGIDFYLPFLRLSSEIKYALGFLNMIDHQETSRPRYKNAIEKLQSNLVILSFHFE